MFGYSQGIIATVQVQPPFIKRMYHKNVNLEQTQAAGAGVDPFVQGPCFILDDKMKRLFDIFKQRLLYLA
jgi:hypothetical protein